MTLSEFTLSMTPRYTVTTVLSVVWWTEDPLHPVDTEVGLSVDPGTYPCSTERSRLSENGVVQVRSRGTNENSNTMGFIFFEEDKFDPWGRPPLFIGGVRLLPVTLHTYTNKYKHKLGHDCLAYGPVARRVCIGLLVCQKDR